MTNTTTTQITITSLEDDWTERTVVIRCSRRRVLHAMDARKAAFSLADRIFPRIREILDCDLYGELAQAAEVEL